jgi:hypothetical protein
MRRFISLAVLASALLSCGLEVFLYLYPVSIRDFEPSETDESKNSYQFRTSDEVNNDEAGAFFKGFEIYYKIYNNKSVLSSARGAINSYNSSNPALAQSYLVNDKQYNRLYCGLRGMTSPLIPAAASNRIIRVRMNTYVDVGPGIYITDLYDVPIETLGLPLRSNNEPLSSEKARFLFDEIGEDDSDVVWSSWDDVNQKKVYVHAYVVAFGTDKLKNLYSELCDLGFITIPEP